MSEHKKKRSREEDETNGGRKHKRSKSQAQVNEDADPETQLAAETEEAQLRNGEEPKKKKKKQHHDAEQNGDKPTKPEKKRSKKDKSQCLSNEKVVDSDEQQKPEPEVEEPQDERQEEKPAKKHKKNKKKHVEEPAEDAMELDAPEEPKAEEQEEEVEQAAKKRDRKSKKEKKRRDAIEAPIEDKPELPAPEEVAEEVPSERKHKSKDKSKKKRKHAEAESAAQEKDEMELDNAQDTSSDVEFPFYTQTVALYLPLFPSGFGAPITAACQQHLDPMLNHYSSILGGVALSYKNVNIGEKPVAADPENPPSDDTLHAELQSIDEYAVGFGYVTADFELFKPRRGAWMEGRINLQTDGHIGLVCWDRFNASVEAKRLPVGWTWVDESKDSANDEDVDMNEDEEESTKNGDVKIHSSGYWADASGARVTGMVRFRISAFDAGTAGDHGYMSIRGTMLSPEAEKRLAAQEREVDRQRRMKMNPYGVQRPMTRRLPEASMTNFTPAGEEQEERVGRRAGEYKGSLPQTPV